MVAIGRWDFPRSSMESDFMIRYFKHGGLRFFRIGRLQISFCIVKSQLQKDIEAYERWIGFETFEQWKRLGKPNNAEDILGDLVTD